MVSRRFISPLLGHLCFVCMFTLASIVLCNLEKSEGSTYSSQSYFYPHHLIYSAHIPINSRDDSVLGHSCFDPRALTCDEHSFPKPHDYYATTTTTSRMLFLSATKKCRVDFKETMQSSTALQDLITTARLPLALRPDNLPATAPKLVSTCMPPRILNPLYQPLFPAQPVQEAWT